MPLFQINPLWPSLKREMLIGPQNCSCVNKYPSIWKVNVFELLIFFAGYVNNKAKQVRKGEVSAFCGAQASPGRLETLHLGILKHPRRCICQCLTTVPRTPISLARQAIQHRNHGHDHPSWVASIPTMVLAQGCALKTLPQTNLSL